MARIAVGGFHHETNSFAAARADFARFEEPDAWPGLTRGEALPEALAGRNIGISGFLAAAAEAGHALAPLLWANAGPCGPVTEDAFERIAGELVDRLSAAGPVDAVYLCLHGAMVAEHLEDGEGELLRRVRAAAGEVPVLCSLDFHANVTEAMVAHASALISYRTYPHLDMAETGARAARLLNAILREGAAPAKAFAKGGYLIPISQQTTLAEPARSLFAALPGFEGAGDPLASVSLTCGFPPADIAECGPAVLCYARDPAAAEASRDALAGRLAAAEADFAGGLLSPEEAVAEAIRLSDGTGRPVVLADTQDNPGAGAGSDTTGLLRALIAADAPGALLGLLCDPDAALDAHRSGVGATRPFRLGGRSGVVGDAPCEARCRVEALSDGAVTATGPFYGGSLMALGPMALLRVEGTDVRVVVASRPQQAADRAMFAHLGAEPAEARILALKSSVHFRADFQALAEAVLVVEAPGPNIDDPARLPYRRLRRGVRLRPGGPAHSVSGVSPS